MITSHQIKQNRNQISSGTSFLDVLFKYYRSEENKDPSINPAKVIRRTENNKELFSIIRVLRFDGQLSETSSLFSYWPPRCCVLLRRQKSNFDPITVDHSSL